MTRLVAGSSDAVARLRAAIEATLVASRRDGQASCTIQARQHEIRLNGNGAELRLCVDIALPASPDDDALAHLCRVAVPSIKQFDAVALLDDRARLVRLARRLAVHNAATVMQAAEQMLHQAAVWQHMLDK
jgi:hypothetical protein